MSEWFSSAEALRLVSAATSAYRAPRAICSRAHAGLVKAKAARFTRGDQTSDDVMVPKEFWWADGGAALEQDWAAGDFETWLNDIVQIHMKAFGVTFARDGIEALIAPAVASRPIGKATNPGGRPRADFWDAMWAEICRQLYVGELKPRKQSDIASTMRKWATAQGHDPADSTIRLRARMLWIALNKDD